MRIHLIVLLALLLLASSSCAPNKTTFVNSANNQPQEDPSQTPFPNSSDNSTQTSNPLETPNSMSLHPETDQFVNLAKQDLAKRLNMNSDQVNLLKTIEITWSDISKGCTPASGQILSKGQLSGYRIWLEAKNEEYIYHVGLNSQIILCPKFSPGVNNPLLMTPDGSALPPQDSSP